MKNKIDDCADEILKRWFVITPKCKAEPEGDVWGMDTSLGGIDFVKEDIKKVLNKYFKGGK